MSQRVLITGGAGFVGSSLALAIKRHFDSVTVIAFDNLRRAGSEITLDRLRTGGVEFVHGDVRCPDDLAGAGSATLVIDASAEPSVHAGYGGSPSYLLMTNLGGAIHCLEYARRYGADLVFVSTSRVYPIAQLRSLPIERTSTRFVLPANVRGVGVSAAGISERFPLDGSRSLYGATKLAAELLIEEYCAMYGLRAVIHRCGVLTGPWQMGKVDQGFVVLWLARHFFGGPLAYRGFGGEGLQVRDVLHVDDLADLVIQQMTDLESCSGRVYNVGGGIGMSVSLRELTVLCQDISGRKIDISEIPDTRDADIPYYVSDCATVHGETNWQPRRSLASTIEDIWRWLADNRDRLKPVLSR